MGANIRRGSSASKVLDAVFPRTARFTSGTMRGNIVSYSQVPGKRS